MNKKIVLLAYASILLLSCVGIGFQLIKPVRAATTWTVDDDGPADFHTIQEAINAASLGDTIIVRAGTYTENVKVNKEHLTIKSESGAEKTIVQATNSQDCVIWIYACHVSISGFTVRGATGPWHVDPRYQVTGIYVLSTEYCNIFDNIAEDNYYGIATGYSANNNIITRNKASTNTIGIGIYSCCSKNSSNEEREAILPSPPPIDTRVQSDLAEVHSDNELFHNEVLNNDIGIFLYYSTNNRIYLNNFIDNMDNVLSENSDSVWDSPEEVTYTYKGNTYTNYLGNYWDDYTGSDADGDGIGDASYSIDSDKDNYPLMERFENYFAPPPTPDFSITASPTSLTTRQGDSDASMITITSINGFNQPVQLTVSGVPSGVTTTLSPEQVTPPPDGSTTSTLTVSVDTTATPGSYTLTVTGASGALTPKYAYVSLDITALPPLPPTSITFEEEGHVKVIRDGWRIRKTPEIKEDNIIKGLPAGSVGLIVAHEDNGRYADGFYWWYVRFEVEGETYEGWCAENGLMKYKLTHKDQEVLNTREKRIRAIREAIEDFSLKGGFGLRNQLISCDQNFFNIFPPELILAIIAQETGGVDYDNTAKGDGIMQVTTASGYHRGKENCDETIYVNTVEGIRENIKDGLMSLYDHYIHDSYRDQIGAVWRYNGGSDPYWTYGDFRIYYNKDNKLVQNEGITDYSVRRSPLYDQPPKDPEGKDYKHYAEVKAQGDKEYLRHMASKLKENGMVGKDFGEEYVNPNLASKLEIAQAGVDNVMNIIKLDEPAKCRDDPNLNPFTGGDDNEWLPGDPISYSRIKRTKVILHSPVELRVYDSQRRVAGLVNGEIREEIPNSMYNEENKTLTILFSYDTYRYEAVGIDEGTYGLAVISIAEEEVTTFTATNIPTSTNAIHQYSIDWVACSHGEEGVTVQIDLDGDGVFEHIFTSDSELTQSEYISATDKTPPTTTLSIGEPKYVTEITHVTPDTLFTLEASDNGGSGVYSTSYRIRNSAHDSGWIIYTIPFYLSSLTDGIYTIEFNSTDNAGNIEATNSIEVTLFSWNYVFEDSYSRGTILKINIEHKFFQFITPDGEYSIRKATRMRVYRARFIIIRHKDSELRLITLAVDTKRDFCVAIAWDKQTRTRYFLIDKPGIE